MLFWTIARSPKATFRFPAKIQKAQQTCKDMRRLAVSFLPSAYRSARVISTDTLRIFLVLEVSSREQERE
jgi:hypothetical protein